MPNQTSMSGSHRRGVVADFLGEKIQPGSRLAAVSASIARTFQKRVAAGLQSGRDLVIPGHREQAGETTDFGRITWLVVKVP